MKQSSQVFEIPKTCIEIRDAWHKPYLIWTWIWYIENSNCKLSRSDFDKLCIRYKIRNPLPKK